MSNASRSRPRTLRSIGLLGLAVVVGSSALTACGGDDSGRLTIYSGRTKELVDPLLQKFSQESGIKIDVKYGDSAQLATLIATEGDKSPADVFFSQTPSGLKFIDEQGLLTALPQSTLDRVASTDRAADGDWVATSGRVRIVAYNPDSVAGTELPSGVADLTGPAWTGAVGISPTNGSFIEFMATFAAIEGEAAAKDFLAGLKANGVKTYANNVAIIDAITRGEIKVGLINHYYVAQKLAAEPDAKIAVGNFAGNDLGNLVLVAGAGVLKTNDQGDAATKFVDFLLSDASQQFFATETKEYPVVSGVAAPDGLAAFDSLTGPRSAQLEVMDLPAVQALIDAAGLNS